jgi:hypothetical protein
MGLWKDQCYELSTQWLKIELEKVLTVWAIYMCGEHRCAKYRCMQCGDMVMEKECARHEKWLSKKDFD